MTRRMVRRRPPRTHPAARRPSIMIATTTRSTDESGRRGAEHRDVPAGFPLDGSEAEVDRPRDRRSLDRPAPPPRHPEPPGSPDQGPPASLLGTRDATAILDDCAPASPFRLPSWRWLTAIRLAGGEPPPR